MNENGAKVLTRQNGLVRALEAFDETTDAEVLTAAVATLATEIAELHQRTGVLSALLLRDNAARLAAAPKVRMIFGLAAFGSSPRSILRPVSRAYSSASCRRRNELLMQWPLRRTSARQFPEGSLTITGIRVQTSGTANFCSLTGQRQTIE